MGKLTGRTCLVTGAGRGIGEAIAVGLAAEGAHVAVLDLDLASAEAVARRLGSGAMGVAADVSDPDQIDKAIGTVTSTMGSIDVLVNNAGIDTSASVLEMSLATWDRMIAVNLRSVFLCTRAVLPGMVERAWGRVINISSQLAQKGAADMSHYAAAKAGVIGFTRSLAYEVAAKGIAVNAVCPGPVDTELWRAIPQVWRDRKLSELPIGRPAATHEIVPTVVLLASDEGSYYIGATLNPNGGDVMV